MHSDVSLQVEKEAKSLAHIAYLEMLLFREEAAMGWVDQASGRRQGRGGMIWTAAPP